MKLLAILFIVPCILADCGKRPAGFSRVMNGINAKPHSWPWQISLRAGSRERHICGGTLIHPNWVVTAAHCVEGKDNNPSNFKVRVGVYRRQGTTAVQKQHDVQRVIIHPEYSRVKGIYNDIALLQLTKPVALNDKVNLACLPTKHVTVGAKCYITGWGKRANGAAADYLQQGVMPPVSHETCRKKWRVEFKSNLCAGHARSGAVGGCQGDSGGPFVCEENGRWVLHGAVSYGAQWCDVTSYTVFARVFTYMGWIKGYLGQGPLPTYKPTQGPATPPKPNTRPPQPPTNRPGGCVDSWGSRCRFYKGQCKSSSFIKEVCKKTCGVC